MPKKAKLTLGLVSTVLGIAIIGGGAAYSGKMFDDHLEDYELTKAQVLFQQCVQECQELCRRAGAEEQQCQCVKHCREKYLEG